MVLLALIIHCSSNKRDLHNLSLRIDDNPAKRDTILQVTVKFGRYIPFVSAEDIDTPFFAELTNLQIQENGARPLRVGGTGPV